MVTADHECKDHEKKHARGEEHQLGPIRMGPIATLSLLEVLGMLVFLPLSLTG